MKNTYVPTIRAAQSVKSGNTSIDGIPGIVRAMSKWEDFIFA